MHYFQEPLKCSKCGSIDYETFHRGPHYSGVRCLGCKHEKINTPPDTTGSVGVYQNLQNVPKEF